MQKAVERANLEVVRMDTQRLYGWLHFVLADVSVVSQTWRKKKILLIEKKHKKIKVRIRIRVELSTKSSRTVKDSLKP